MRAKFHKELDSLKSGVCEMGRVCQDMNALILHNISFNDDNLYEKAVEYRECIEQKEQFLQTLSNNLFIKQQPVASDFQFIANSIKIISELRRIAEVHYNALIILHELTKPIECTEIKTMVQIVNEMLHSVLSLYCNGDAKAAEQIPKNEERIDDSFSQAKLSVISALKNDSTQADFWLESLMLAKHLEKIADHIFIIYQWIKTEH